MTDLNQIPLFSTEITKDKTKKQILIRCSMCQKKISKKPLEGYFENNILLFCDLICAKLYYDNVEKIIINQKKYRYDYKNNQLGKFASIIYEICINKEFELMPEKKITENERKNLDIVKKEYKSGLN